MSFRTSLPSFPPGGLAVVVPVTVVESLVVPATVVGMFLVVASSAEVVAFFDDVGKEVVMIGISQ